MPRKPATPIIDAVTQLDAAGRQAKEALAARAEALVAKAVALRERVARDFWELGRVLARMREENVHVALGYERFDDLVAERIGVARTIAWKLIAVAEQLPRADAVKLGQEKAYAVVALAKATPDVDSAAALARSDAEVAGKPLSQASLRELQSAVAAARPRRPQTMAARERQAEDRQFAARVRSHLAPAGIPKASVTVEGESIVIRLTRRQAERLLAR